MSSHREAPSIAQDPTADNTDVYAFVSSPGKVTIICSFSPFQLPASGPNFYEFGDDVQYQIMVDNNGDGIADIKYLFKFTTTISNPNTFLYNTGPIAALDSPNLVRKQTYSVTKVVGTTRTEIGSNIPVPPYNIGPRSTPNYQALADAAIRTLNTGERVFAGSREDSFFVDIGSVFDLGTLRPVQDLHLLPTMAAPGVDTLKDSNVQSICLEIPISSLTRDGSTPTDVMAANSVIGVWSRTGRQKGMVLDKPGRPTVAGPSVQISRLGNPLINEVIIPMSKKDTWNANGPSTDSVYAPLYKRPELAKLLPVLYPTAFPNLKALNDRADRADLVAILLTGIPAGIVPGFQNSTGTTMADMLRLNVAVPPTANPNPLGLIGGDAAGFPNGRRLTDDVTTIELRAIAGATYKLVDPTYTPDAAAGAIADGSYSLARRNFTGTFPFIGLPHSGYAVPA